MKKLILASLLLSTSLGTSAVFAENCQFNITLNSEWGGYPTWVIVVTDISNPAIVEVVGGTQLLRDTGTPKGNGYKLTVPVSNCSNSTQIGIFGHTPGAGVAAESGVKSQDQIRLMGGANNVLTGMSPCIGDISDSKKTRDSGMLNVNLTLGNPRTPGDFLFGTPDWANSWTKTQMGAVCKNPGPFPDASDD